MACSEVCQQAVAEQGVDGHYAAQAKIAAAGCTSCLAAFDAEWLVDSASGSPDIQVGNSHLSAMEANGALTFSYTQTQNVNSCERKSVYSVQLGHTGGAVTGTVHVVHTPACDTTSAASCTCDYNLSGRFTSAD